MIKTIKTGKLLFKFENIVFHYLVRIESDCFSFTSR